MKWICRLAVFMAALLLLAPASARAAAPGWITSCNYSHSASDDPIVFPSMPGASHLHDFVGATTTEAFSTPDSLRAGGTLCAMPADSSAYWVPRMYIHGGTTTVVPSLGDKDALFYYRRKAAPTDLSVRAFPDGLKMILGNAHAASLAEEPQGITFKCGPGSGTETRTPPAQCSSGVMVVVFIFPNCWNGIQLDSADHLSHMAYPVSGRCPADHPVVLPRIQAFWRYTVGTAPIGTVSFSSGPYWTVHQDFLNAWEPAGLAHFVDVCINALVDCGKNPAR